MQRPLVLNVNDHASARYVVTKMLQNSGFDVVEAASGGEALESARLHRPVVVVLDIKLPDIDGIELCRLLKADRATEGIAVIHTSATYLTTDMRPKSLESGAEAWLAQPFTAQELAGTVRSLVRLKEAEQKQRERADHLAELDKKKDEFLAMLAHELRNPVAAVSASLAVIEHAPPRDEAEARARGVGRRQIDHLARLMEGLLDVSRVVRGVILVERRPVLLREIVERAVDVARAAKAAPKGQVIELVLEGADRGVVDGDAARLEQLVANLLDNASKFSPTGARIEVRLSVRAGIGETLATLTVTDEGDGIGREMLPRVFDLFYQGPVSNARRAGGLGLGLTMVRNVVDLHGGQVTVRSPGRGKGTTVEVALPVLDGRGIDAGAASTSSSRGEARPLEVLLVEDNDDVGEMMEELLMMWGHNVVRASDGLEGARLGTTRAFDVALVDVGLPGIDGCEVARRLRAHPRAQQARLVALTGYGSPEVRVNTRDAGFDRHMVKPPDPNELRALLDETPRVELWHLGDHDGEAQTKRADNPASL